MGKLNINNGGVDTNKKMPDIDERFGPYNSIEAANAALGGQGRNTITAGLTVGILTANAGVKEYWYQPNKKTGQLELIPKGGNAADNPTEGNFASFDENGNVVDSGNKADDFAPIEQAVPMGDEDDEGKILEKQASGFGWVEKPVDGDDAYHVWLEANGYTEAEHPVSEYNEYNRGKSAREIYNATYNKNLNDAEFAAELKMNYPMLHVGYDSTNAGATVGVPFNGNLNPNGDNIGASDTTIGKLYLMPDAASDPENCIGFVTVLDGQTYKWCNVGAISIPSDALAKTDVDNECVDGATDEPASAKAVMDLKAKLEGVTASEEKVQLVTSGEGQNVFAGKVVGASGDIDHSGSNDTNYKYIEFEIPSNVKSIRFMTPANTGWTSGWAIGHYNDGNFVKDRSSAYVSGREFIVEVKEGETHFRTNCYMIYSTPTDRLLGFYCYLQSGNTVKDLIPEVVDSFYSDDATKSLSAAKGKELHDVLIETTKIGFTKLEGYDASGDVDETFTPSPSTGRSLFKYNIEEGKDYFLYGGYSKSAGTNWYIYYWTDDDDVIIKKEWYGSNFPTSSESPSYNYWAGVKRTAPPGATRLYQRGYTAATESKIYIELQEYKETLTKKDIANDFNGGVGKALSAEKGKEIFNNLSVEKKLTQVGNAFKCNANTLKSMPQGTNIEENCGSSDVWRMWKYEVLEGDGVTMTGYVGLSYAYYHIYWADSSGNLISKDGLTTRSNARNKQFTFSSVAPEGAAYVYILVKYVSTAKYDVYYTTEQRQMLDIDEIVYIAKKEAMTSKTLNVLVIGNSFTQNAMLYVPFLWSNIVEGYSLNLSFFMASSCPLYHYVDTYENGATSYDEYSYRYYTSQDGGVWEMKTGVSVKSRILNEEFDIVIFQLTTGNSSIGSAEHVFPTTSEHYRYYVNRFIELIAADAKKRVKFMLLKAHSSANGHTSWSDEKRLAELTTTWNNYLSIAESVEKNTATEGLIRTDTAVMNAYQIPQMLDIGQIGFLSYDNHLQRGLPLQLEGYTVLLHLIGMIDKSLSVIGDYTISDSSWESGKLGTTDAATQHGDPTGWSNNDEINKYRLLVIQESALMAYRYPNEITDMTKICVTE